eukprot:11574763-Heterocapsa_arctica.AAC.1
MGNTMRGTSLPRVSAGALPRVSAGALHATLKCPSATSGTCDQRTGSPATTSSSSDAGNALHQIKLPAASYMPVAVKAVTALSVFHGSL